MMRNTKKQCIFFIPILLLVATLLTCGKVSSELKPFKIKTVIVSFFEKGNMTGDDPGEAQFWVENEKLDQVIPFPNGHANLRMNDKGVLNIVTGMGTANSAASIMALGKDKRFDLSKAYWIMAGIAGGDPEDISVSSVALARYTVDADMRASVDLREISTELKKDPQTWKYGTVPFFRASYKSPSNYMDIGAAFKLNPGLVKWAYSKIKDIQLPDDEKMKKVRAQYKNYPNARKAPHVMIGDNLDGLNFWVGKLKNDWANFWVKYHTNNKGNFVTSAMEDTGVMRSLLNLNKSNLVDINRVLILRAVSNYTVPHAGITAVESLSKENHGSYSGELQSLKALYTVGSPLVHEIIDNWKVYEKKIPKG